MIDFAGKEDIPRLREIWKICFGDPDSYLDFYYERGFPLFETLIDREKGQPVSMLTVVPASYRTAERTVKAGYLYAVGTLPEFRGEGRSSRLIRETHEYMRKQGMEVAFLFPASESLYRFYGKLGYRIGFSIEESSFRADRDRSRADVSRCGKQLFLQLSRRYMNSFRTATLFDEPALGYFYDEILSTGGDIVFIKTGALQGYAVCYTINKTLFVKETSLSLEELGACAPSLAAYFKADEVRARVRPEHAGQSVPHGMLCLLSDDDALLDPNASGYMNLVLD